MASIYIETSIVSYLRERQASQVVAAARQILTKRWWSDERKKYTQVTSQYVIDEACLGDSVLAQERLLHLDNLPLLAVDPEILVLADALMSSAALPRKAGCATGFVMWRRVVRPPFGYRRCDAVRCGFWLVLSKRSTAGRYR